jgi:hypothetical protein
MIARTAAEWRDPVQLYCMRVYHRWLLVLGVLVVAAAAAAYWYLYFA